MMDELRDDLRAVFNRQQEGLGELTGSRQRVLRSALGSRDEPIGRRTQLAAGIAAALIAVLVIATFAYVRAWNRTQTVAPAVASPARMASPSPVASPMPTGQSSTAGLYSWDIDLLDSATAWTLLTNCNSSTSDPCNYFVAATTDGGRTWSNPVPIATSFDPRNGDAPRTIRFINSADGFVYGGGGAFVTHDGGKSWAALDLHAVFFNAITGHEKTVWAFTYPCPKGTYCPYDARLSSDGGRTWSAPHSLPLGLSPFALNLFGTSGAFISDIPGQMVITSDGGITWRSIETRCRNNPYRTWVATSDGHELWALCMGYPQLAAVPQSATPTSQAGSEATADKALFFSQDGGLTWAQKGTSQTGGTLPPLGTWLSLISTRPNKLLLGTNMTPIMLTSDTASHWTQIQTSPSSGVQWMRFINPQVGWAMDNQGAIWSTTDGGASWTRLRRFNAVT